MFGVECYLSLIPGPERFLLFVCVQAICIGDEPSSCHVVKVPNESTFTESVGPLRSGDNEHFTSRTSGPSRFHEDGVGSLAQVVSKFVCIEQGHVTGSSSSHTISLIDSSQCFVSTQASNSEDLSTSSVSPSIDTATSPNSVRFLSVSVGSSDPPSAAEMIYCSTPIFNQNPDDLQNILIPCASSSLLNKLHQSGGPRSNVSSQSIMTRHDIWNGICCETSESWSSLCELPAAWQYYTDPGMVANDMEYELIDVTRELAMRKSVACQSCQDDGCEECFMNGDWQFLHCDAADSLISCVSNIGGDEYLCNDIYSNHGIHADSLSQALCNEHQSFAVLAEEPLILHIPDI